MIAATSAFNILFGVCVLGLLLGFVSVVRWLDEDSNKKKSLYPAVLWTTILTGAAVLLFCLLCAVKENLSSGNKFDDDAPSYPPDFH